MFAGSFLPPPNWILILIDAEKEASAPRTEPAKASKHRERPGSCPDCAAEMQQRNFTRVLGETHDALLFTALFHTCASKICQNSSTCCFTFLWSECYCSLAPESPDNSRKVTLDKQPRWFLKKIIRDRVAPSFRFQWQRKHFSSVQSGLLVLNSCLKWKRQSNRNDIICYCTTPLLWRC